MSRYRKKKAVFGLCLLGTSLLAAACSSGSKSYRDGTYTAKSSIYEALSDEDEDEGGDGYGKVTITLKDNKIVECSFTTYMTDGTVKDEDYGKQDGEIANQDYYNKAQRAVRASENYAVQLAAKGSLDEVDAISGATISYNEFREAVQEALKQAK